MDVHLVDVPLQLLVHRGRIHLHPVRAGKRCNRVRIGGDQGGDVGTAIADHHRVGHQRVPLERGLDVARRDVLATGGDDQVLLAIR